MNIYTVFRFDIKMHAFISEMQLRIWILILITMLHCNAALDQTLEESPDMFLRDGIICFIFAAT